MTRQSDAGNPVLREANEKQLTIFKAKMKEWGFRKLTTEEKIKIIYGKKLEAPSRVTEENVLQLMYVCDLPNGYDIFLILGLLEDQFTISGYPWVHIRNEDDKLVAVWKFSKNNICDLLKRIAAYAHYAKFIAQKRPLGTELVEVSYMTYQWQYSHGKIEMEVNPIVPLGMLSKTDEKIVSAGEKSRMQYWEKSEGKVKYRQRDKHSTWKKNKRK